MPVISVRVQRTCKPNVCALFEAFYICKDRVHYVAMPCSQFGYNNVYIISGVMNMMCCCAIFFPLFLYCICPEPMYND